MAKIITIGSATMDVFVECDEANIVSVCTKDSNSEFMSYPYGSKIDISKFASNVGGGGVNTACNFANLGFDTSAIFKITDNVTSSFFLKRVNVADERPACLRNSALLISFSAHSTHNFLKLTFI